MAPNSMENSRIPIPIFLVSASINENLGGFGEGGAILTNNPDYDRAFRMYRNYGSEKRYYNQVVGTNSRLDELQAGLLRVKLAHLNETNEERQRLTDRYALEIKIR